MSNTVQTEALFAALRMMIAAADEVLEISGGTPQHEALAHAADIASQLLPQAKDCP